VLAGATASDGSIAPPLVIPTLEKGLGGAWKGLTGAGTSLDAGTAGDEEGGVDDDELEGIRGIGCVHPKANCHI
jgi:hypothetical protein